MNMRLSICALALTASIASAGATIPIAWTNPTTNEDGTPLIDAATVAVEYSTNFGAWTPLAQSVRQLIPGKAMTYTVPATSNGIWKLRVVCYDDAGNRSVSKHEYIAWIAFGRKWLGIVNEV